jgi:hypothetical protein
MSAGYLWQAADGGATWDCGTAWAGWWPLRGGRDAGRWRVEAKLAGWQVYGSALAVVDDFGTLVQVEA